MDAEEETQVALARWLQSAAPSGDDEDLAVPESELSFKSRKQTHLRIKLCGLTWMIGMQSCRQNASRNLWMVPPPSSDCYLRVVNFRGSSFSAIAFGESAACIPDFCRHLIFACGVTICDDGGLAIEVYEELAPLAFKLKVVWKKEKTLTELLDALNAFSLAVNAFVRAKLDAGSLLAEEPDQDGVFYSFSGRNWMQLEIEAASSRCVAARDSSTTSTRTATATLLRECLQEWHEYILLRQEGVASCHAYVEEVGDGSSGASCRPSSVLSSNQKRLKSVNKAPSEVQVRASRCGWLRSCLFGGSHRRKVMEELEMEECHDVVTAVKEMDRFRNGATVKKQEIGDESRRRVCEMFSGAALHVFLQQAFRCGDVLQWCDVMFNQGASSLVCELQVSEFMCDALAAASIGISVTLPLQIQIVFDVNYDGSTLEVHATQGSDLEDDTTHTQSSFGLSRLVPHMAKRFFQEPGNQEAMKAAYRKNRVSTPDENIFVAFLQHMVVALASLNTLCPCCGSFHIYTSASRLLHPCQNRLCRAQFAMWIAVTPTLDENLLEKPNKMPADFSQLWELELLKQELAVKANFPLETAENLEHLHREVARNNLVACDGNYEQLVYALAFMKACKEFKQGSLYAEVVSSSATL